MTTLQTNVSRAGILPALRDALTDGPWSLNVDEITDSDFFVVNLGSESDSLYVEMPTEDTLEIRHGLNWENQVDGFTHPNPTPDNCEDPTHPGEIWSATTSLSRETGAITYGPGWLAWHGRNDGYEIRIATAALATSTDYQSFQETLTCDCAGADDPVDACDSEDDTYTRERTGYRAQGYVAVALRGGTFTETWGTITGDRTGDIRTTPTSARLGDNDYGRDSGWELERLDGSLAGTHEGWMLSDDQPVNLSDRGEVTANGTYTSPKPSADDALYKL